MEACAIASEFLSSFSPRSWENLHSFPYLHRPIKKCSHSGRSSWEFESLISCEKVHDLPFLQPPGLGKKRHGALEDEGAMADTLKSTQT